MNRLHLTALMGLTLLLTACPQPAAPSALRDAQVKAGPALSVPFQAAFAGSWIISGLPDWLSASPSSGSGNVKTTFFVKRSEGAPHAANRSQLSAPVNLTWTTDSGASGSATLTVSADLYPLSGQVSVAVTSAQPLPGPAPLRVSGEAAARGVIVKYKTEAAFRAAQSGAAFSAQLMSAQSGRTLTLAHSRH